MKKNILDLLNKSRLYFDGGTGTVLEEMGLPFGVAPEEWTLSHPKKILDLHRSYLEAGANIIKTNTFGVNSLKYENYDEYIKRAIELAKEATEGYKDAFVAFDVGPLGRMLSPLGTLDFSDAVEVFSKSVRVAAECGVDLILIETMTDSYETKAAVLAAKESCDLPIFVTNVYDENSKLMTGASPEAMVALLEGLGVAALGANCSLGPDKLMPTVKRLLTTSSIPVICNPNAGLPTYDGDKNIFDITPDRFTELMCEMAEMGVSVLGGCCGTTPDYIASVVGRTKEIPFVKPTLKGGTVVSSYTNALSLGDKPILIGERINPTGKPKLKRALSDGDISYILSEALGEAECGADALDVNVGLPGIDEKEMLRKVVYEVQSVTDLPLQLDSGNPEALEAAMRIYNGKPLVNSVNGKEESLSRVLPLVKKYGGVLIALTMDEEGIPETVEGRVEIAEKILSRAESYGISPRDIIFDPLCMAVSASKDAARVTLGAIAELHRRGYRTSLGVSNVSFGLPMRDNINAAFFTLALEAGLDAAIMNPYSAAMMTAYHSHLALSGEDEGFDKYIAFCEKTAHFPRENTPTCDKNAEGSEIFNAEGGALSKAIVKGLKSESNALARELLRTKNPLDLINGEIIPALSSVGESFEKGKTYLPKLLMSAEAAVSAFNAIKEVTPRAESAKGHKILIATVKGDIHDIGKNIVKLLLDSHGYEVIDLGRDVPPEIILSEAQKTGAGLVGLSALMTTTLSSMEETIRLLKKSLPDVKIMVGGAVLTEEYAMKIGADFYAGDAMAAVRCAGIAFASDGSC